MTFNLTHLRQLESESIFIMREVISEFEKPAMLYSIGKDSSVMLHLLQKAFYPATPPLPLVHIDTTWKFKEMIEFRDKRAKKLGMELIVYTNPKDKEINISPFIHGSNMHTDIMKTETLKKMLDLYQFDAVFGGADAMRKNLEQKREFIPFVMKITLGILKINTHNFGIYIMDVIKKENP